MAKTPYRQPSGPPAAEAPPPEWVYVAVDRESNKGAAMALVPFSIPLVVGAGLSVLTTPTIALVGMVASAGGLVWMWKRAPNARKLVLRVYDGQLIVLDGARKKERARARLGDLVNVSLDTKTIQRVEEGGDAIPAMRFINSRVGLEVDTARILLETRDAPPFALTDAYLAHMDASESLGKLRVFLRKHGWVPEDERDRESVPDGDG